MSLQKTILLFVTTLLSIAVVAQTISPAPTAAGFPFWATNQGGKITRGNDGAVYFAQFGRIARLSLKGSLKIYQVDSTGSMPTGIYWGPDNNLWFAMFSGVIGKLNPATGSITRYTNISNTDVFDLTIGPDGHMWASSGLFIYRISTTGSFTRFPISFTVSMLRKGPDGAMWMMETFGRKVARMTTSGAITNVWPLSGNPGPACGPTCAAITAGPDGNMWFTQGTQLPQIGRITMSGQITYFPLTGQGAGDIAWGHDKGIWFVDNAGKHIGRISTSGALTYYDPVGQDQFSSLSCLSSSPDGNIYFTGTLVPTTTGFSTGAGKIVLWIPEGVSGTNVSATHEIKFSGEVGDFTDFEVINGTYFNATANWGDGTSSKVSVQRTVSGSPNRFEVLGSHTYAHAGHYPIQVLVKEPGDKYQFSMSSMASVQ
jgi:virginiamycin B lyase